MLEEENAMLKSEGNELTLQLLEAATPSGPSSASGASGPSTAKPSLAEEEAVNSALTEAKQEIVRLQQQMKDAQTKTEESAQVMHMIV